MLNVESIQFIALRGNARCRPTCPSSPSRYQRPLEGFLDVDAELRRFDAAADADGELGDAVAAEEAIEGELFIIRKGKKDNFLIRIERGVDSAKPSP